MGNMRGYSFFFFFPGHKCVQQGQVLRAKIPYTKFTHVANHCMPQHPKTLISTVIDSLASRCWTQWWHFAQHRCSRHVVRSRSASSHNPRFILWATLSCLPNVAGIDQLLHSCSRFLMAQIVVQGSVRSSDMDFQTFGTFCVTGNCCGDEQYVCVHRVVTYW